jgi:hypothetical protein
MIIIKSLIKILVFFRFIFIKIFNIMGKIINQLNNKIFDINIQWLEDLKNT